MDCPDSSFCSGDGLCYGMDEFGCDVDDDCPPEGVCGEDGYCMSAE